MNAKRQNADAAPARAASVHARLLKRAKKRGEDFNLLLTRYAVERFLYRLSVSPAREQFLLKGALLFDLWFDVPHRPTRDADLLGFGPADANALTEVMRSICAVAVDDAMIYDQTSVTTIEIREEANYGGLRVRLLGMLGKARCSVQVDVGYGDAVTPAPVDVELPTLLHDSPAPRLRAYPRETVVAEKLEAITSLGIANSRMKDFFDLRALLREGALDDETLARAIAATFQRRGTRLPERLPLGLTSEFALDALKQKQWRAFLEKNRIEAPALEAVIEEIAAVLSESLGTARSIEGRAV